MSKIFNQLIYLLDILGRFLVGLIVGVITPLVGLIAIPLLFLGSVSTAWCKLNPEKSFLTRAAITFVESLKLACYFCMITPVALMLNALFFVVFTYAMPCEFLQEGWRTAKEVLNTIRDFYNFFASEFRHPIRYAYQDCFSKYNFIMSTIIETGEVRSKITPEIRKALDKIEHVAIQCYAHHNNQKYYSKIQPAENPRLFLEIRSAILNLLDTRSFNIQNLNKLIICLKSHKGNFIKRSFINSSKVKSILMGDLKKNSTTSINQAFFKNRLFEVNVLKIVFMQTGDMPSDTLKDDPYFNIINESSPILPGPSVRRP